MRRSTGCTAWKRCMGAVLSDGGGVEALCNGSLGDVLDMNVEEESARVGRYVHIILDDGRALAWAPTQDDLAAHP